MEETTSDYDREKLRERLAKLGGGVALLRATPAVDKAVKALADEDERIGGNIVRRTLEDPSDRSRKTPDMKEPSWPNMCGPIRNPHFGFTAQSGEYEDLVKAGILDPTKVVRLAIQNARSIAALMLTTEALVCDIPEKKKAAGTGLGGPGRYD